VHADCSQLLGEADSPNAVARRDLLRFGSNRAVLRRARAVRANPELEGGILLRFG